MTFLTDRCLADFGAAAARLVSRRCVFFDPRLVVEPCCAPAVVLTALVCLLARSFVVACVGRARAGPVERRGAADLRFDVRCGGAVRAPCVRVAMSGRPTTDLRRRA